MKKFIKTMAFSVVTCFIVVVSIVLSACGGGGAPAKATAVTNLTAQRGTGSDGGKIELSYVLQENFDYEKWTGYFIFWVSQIDGENTEIDSMDDNDKDIYQHRFQNEYQVYIPDYTTKYYFYGLPHEHSYVISMKAELENDRFGATLSADEVLLSVTVPSRPITNSGNFTQYYDGGTSTVNIYFYAPTYNGGSPIIRYEVSIDGGLTYSGTVSPKSGQMQTTVTGTKATAMTNFRIRAVNEQGAGEVYSVYGE
jgi:hypothetical protein